MPQLPVQSPYSSQQRESALASMMAKSPYGQYNANHHDVMNSLGGKSAAAFGLDAAKADMDYSLARQSADRALNLQETQNSMQEEQNKQSLMNERLQQMYGFTSSVLGALLR
jgi:hypothetical protein